MRSKITSQNWFSCNACSGGSVGASSPSVPPNATPAPLDPLTPSLFDHLLLQVRVHGFQHVDEERAVKLLADEELVGLDDGVECGPITIHMSALRLH